MALTWDQFGALGLTAGQKTKLAAAETLGKLEILPPSPDLTAAQAKAVLNFTNDCRRLIDPAARGARLVLEKVKRDAAKAADDAIPSGQI